MNKASKDDPAKTQAIINDVVGQFRAKAKRSEYDDLMKRVKEMGDRVSAVVRSHFADSRIVHVPSKEEFFAVAFTAFLDEFTHFTRDELLSICSLSHASLAYESMTWI